MFKFRSDPRPSGGTGTSLPTRSDSRAVSSGLTPPVDVGRLRAQVSSVGHALQDEGWERYGPPILLRLVQEVEELAAAGVSAKLPALEESARALASLLRIRCQKGASQSGQIRRVVDRLVQQLKEGVGGLGNLPWPGSESGVSSAAGPLQVGRRGKLIVLADPDESVGQELAAKIGNAGYSVWTVRTVANLKAAVARTQPSALVSEILFPEGELAGVSVVRELEEVHGRPLSTVFVSNKFDLKTRLQAVRAGARALFRKPVDIRELLEQLDALTGSAPSPALRVLVVQAEPGRAAVLCAKLREAGVEPLVVGDAQGALAEAPGYRPDVVLIDVFPLGSRAAELGSALRYDVCLRETPLLYWSAGGVSAERSSAMCGEGDLLGSRGESLEDVVAIVAAKCRRSRRLRMRAATVAAAARTRLGRGDMVDALLRHWSLARRERTPAAYALLEVTGISSLARGHGTGPRDVALSCLRGLVHQAAPGAEAGARLWGSALPVFLPGVHALAARDLLDRILLRFTQTSFGPPGEVVHATLSGGLTDLAAAASPEEALRKADQALLQAKYKGKNRIQAAGEAERR
ncbi:MAG: hypothetical protein HYZ53_23925 [Planctomycetes bacterium]|nr:hypothetical protein [Planctomycetota bacterium]